MQQAGRAPADLGRTLFAVRLVYVPDHAFFSHGIGRWQNRRSARPVNQCVSTGVGFRRRFAKLANGTFTASGRLPLAHRAQPAEPFTREHQMARRYSRSASRDVEREMRKFKSGKLRSGKGGRGGRVKSRKQAIAIGLSEARRKGKKVPLRGRRRRRR